MTGERGGGAKKRRVRKRRSMGAARGSAGVDAQIQMVSDGFLLCWEVRNIRTELYHCKLALWNWNFLIHKYIWLTIQVWGSLYTGYMEGLVQRSVCAVLFINKCYSDPVILWSWMCQNSLGSSCIWVGPEWVGIQSTGSALGTGANWKEHGPLAGQILNSKLPNTVTL